MLQNVQFLSKELCADSKRCKSWLQWLIYSLETPQYNFINLTRLSPNMAPAFIVRNVGLNTRQHVYRRRWCSRLERSTRKDETKECEQPSWPNNRSARRLLHVLSLVTTSITNWTQLCCATSQKDSLYLSKFTSRMESTLSLHLEHSADVIMQNNLRTRFVASVINMSSS